MDCLKRGLNKFDILAGRTPLCTRRGAVVFEKPEHLSSYTAAGFW